jgi:hypothetical protein
VFWGILAIAGLAFDVLLEQAASNQRRPRSSSSKPGVNQSATTADAGKNAKTAKRDSGGGGKAR